MSFFSAVSQWLKNQFEDSEELHEEERIPSLKVESDDVLEAGALPARSIRPLEVVVMVPTVYADAKKSVQALEKGLVVMVVLNDNVDDEVASRYVDFMSGAVYLAHGDVELLNDNVLICVPESVKLSNDRLVYIADIPTWKGPGL
jgi:cell division inhibitor SepF